LLSVVIAAAIFLFDINLPLGVAGGVPYVALVLLGSWSSRSWFIIALASTGLVLTIVGYFYSPPGGVPWIVLANRGLAIFAICVTAIILLYRLRTRQALNKSEERYRDFTESASDWVWETGPDHCFTFASDRLFEIKNVTRQEVIGKTRWQISENASSENPSKLWEEHKIEMEKHLPIKDFRYKFKDRDGSIQQVSINGKPVFDENGEFLGYRGSGTDITEQFRYSVALDAEKQKAEKYLDVSEAMIVGLNRDGNVETINKKTADYMGYTEQEIVGKNWFSLAIEESDRDEVFNVFKSLMNEQIENFEYFENKIITKRGDSLYISWHNVLQTDQDGKITGTLSSGQNITVRKQLEEEIVQAQERAEIANRSKSEFLANMSHELRTPLNAIIGFSEMLSIKTIEPLSGDKQEEYVNHIHNSGQHLLELINDILDVSTIEADKLELVESSVDIAEAVAASLLLVQARAKQNEVELINKIDHDCPIIRADERRIKQIMLNLLSNAVKFTNPGGTVTISAEKLNDGSISISVADTGIGMNEADLAQALEKFGQAKRGNLGLSGEGTGLGLPLTQGLVERHGGRIEIDSEPDKGTTVIVHIPKDRVLETSLN